MVPPSSSRDVPYNEQRTAKSEETLCPSAGRRDASVMPTMDAQARRRLAPWLLAVGILAGVAGLYNRAAVDGRASADRTISDIRADYGMSDNEVDEGHQTSNVLLAIGGAGILLAAVLHTGFGFPTEPSGHGPPDKSRCASNAWSESTTPARSPTRTTNEPSERSSTPVEWACVTALA